MQMPENGGLREDQTIPDTRSHEANGHQPTQQNKGRLHLGAAGELTTLDRLLEAPGCCFFCLFASVFCHTEDSSEPFKGGSASAQQLRNTQGVFGNMPEIIED